MNQPINRRRLLKNTVIQSAFGAGIVSPLWLPVQSARAGIVAAQDASELIPGKDKRLKVLVDDPAVLETPLKLLYEQYLTPSKLLFVRNNQQPREMSTLKPVADDDWKIQIQDQKISVRQLKEMPQSSVTMVLQCSGNGRSLFSRASQTKGTQWGKGGMGCVTVAGVKLADVLKKLKIEPQSKQKYVLAQGVDKPLPDKEDFLHTLPTDEVINRSMLALQLNGEELPAIHGGPVRLVTPGVFATMHVKWLESLTFVAEESQNYNHVPRYRVPKSPIRPGTDYKFTLSNSDFNWNMKVKTVVLNLEDGQKIPGGKFSVQGVAFNDGSARIESVLVSTNQGQSWKRAKLEQSSGNFGWTRFEAPLQLGAGKHEVWTRAVDAWGRSSL